MLIDFMQLFLLLPHIFLSMAEVAVPQCIFPSAILFISGLWLLYTGTRSYLFLQRVKNTPTSTVRAAAVGLVELFGKAKMKLKTTSPIEKKECAYWRVKAEWHKPGKHGGWRHIADIKSGNPFFLEDETGSMLVDPKGAKVEIPPDHKYEGRMSGKGFLGLPQKKIDQRVLEFLENPEYGHIKEKFMHYNDRKWRVTEFYIAPGDKLYVLGTAAQKEGAPSSTGHENLVVRKGGFENLMYISDRHEKTITGGFRMKALLELGAGFALSAFSLFFLLVSFGITPVG